MEPSLNYLGHEGKIDMRNASNKKTILVADDESNVRQLARNILNQDYEILEAANGEDAVNLAKNKIPDVILMDMMMPRMDGLAACDEIKNNEITKNIPVFILTPSATEFNRRLAKEVWGADQYITKPFTSQDLLNKLADRLSVR
jgi:CheY-like chemotaxis protein